MATTSSTQWGLREPDEEQCRAEVAALLASEQFRRSPKLSRLLKYLCEKQLSGQSAEITEYSIALEALGRTEQFDPQQDAVVRVDTHHLRRKLKEYYAGAGSERPIQISIPNGQYAPLFTMRAPAALPKPLQPVEPDVKSELPPVKLRLWDWRWIAAVVLAATLALLLVARYRYTATGAAPHPAAAAGIPSDEIRIAAGAWKSDYVDTAGRTWLADRYFSGGATFRRAALSIQRTHDPDLFLNGREGQFVYNIPLKPGIYELHLYFAETAVASDTLRSVNVSVNGQAPASFDVASDAGGIDTATMKVLRDISPAADGQLHLMFQGSGPNFLNAIEILPGIRGKMLPIRMTTADHPFRDHQGQLWLPDEWFAGGRKSTRVVPIQGTQDAPLYQWERVGHFSYAIPVAEDGLYTVTLHFSETWFTPPNAIGGIGSRVFDVYCNGSTLLKDFDILKNAGGSGDRAVTQVFRHVAASPLGKIDLEFVPVVNYSLINAIEIVQE